jgi:hypothetical protein
VPREEIPAAPEVGAVPEVVGAVVAPEFAAVPEVVAEQVVDAEFEDEASASNITADVDDLLPPPPAFAVPPMEWLLGGPSAGWLIDDPEREFSGEEFEALPPLVYYAPPGYAPTTEFFQPPTAVHVDMLPSGLASNPLPEMMEENDVEAAAHVVHALPDLNLPMPDEEKAEDTA